LVCRSELGESHVPVTGEGGDHYWPTPTSSRARWRRIFGSHPSVVSPKVLHGRKTASNDINLPDARIDALEVLDAAGHVGTFARTNMQHAQTSR
jgi:hypothetical protein